MLTPIEIVPLGEVHRTAAAVMFVEQFRALRRAVPILPERMEDTGFIAALLERLCHVSAGFAALQEGRVVGYLGWYLVDDFRGTGRKAAYCPEWAHAAVEPLKPVVYRALYRAAAGQWAAAGCAVHALTLLANDQAAEKAWFWNGFGLLVVDAVRPASPIGAARPARLTLRKASLADVPLVMALDAEHWQHYTRAPIFMAPHPMAPESAYRDFLSTPANSTWLVESEEEAAGFLRFEDGSEGASAVVESDDTIAITGAYIRPAFRGLGAAAALLDAALRDYAGQGLARCSVDFEAFNPEAAGFWMRYFEPVCYSLMRIPESMPQTVG